MSQSSPQTHPGIVKVDFHEGDYASQLIAMKDFKEGELIARIEGTTPGPKAYSSVQVSKDTHIELNSDLLYMNHSCAPTAILDVTRMEVRAAKPIATGKPVTFFYPSTEWDMAQPFKCNCGAEECLGIVNGAKHIPRQILSKYVLNQHIKQLLYDSAESHRRDVKADEGEL